MSDAAWLAQLGAHGLVRGPFVPPAPIRQLRDLTRARTASGPDRGGDRRRDRRRHERIPDRRPPRVLGRDLPRQPRVRRAGQVGQDPAREPVPRSPAGHRALSIPNSHGSYRSAKYWWTAARRGPMKAIVAQHAILIAIWTMATTGTDTTPRTRLLHPPRPRTSPTTRPRPTPTPHPQPDRRTSLKKGRLHKGRSSRQKHFGGPRWT